MQRYKLANIVTSGVTQFIAVPSLCRRATAQIAIGPSPTDAKLIGPGSFDFTTYFNGLSVAKWREYTDLDEFHVHLELKGAACRIIQTVCNPFAWEPRLIESRTFELDASDEWRELEFELSVCENDIIAGFLVETDGEVEMRNSHYYAFVPDDCLREVELAIATCTFKKEDYIIRNIELVTSGILESDEGLADHLTMHVIDNGRTLDTAIPRSERVHIHPNANVGGSGGFARGMIEAIRQEPAATHVLLMDDDVSLSPESIIRTYNLLRIVSDQYAEAFVSGAMLNLEAPDALHEDTAYMSARGVCESFKFDRHLHVSNLHDCVTSEVIRPRSDIPGNEDQTQRYAAWWYCCIPVSTILREGLPLPLFIRFDDAEYGLRCHPRFMTMNGICLWHSAFELRYNACTERYQTARNGLVIQATTGVAPLTDFAAAARDNIRAELKKFNYTNAALALKGFEDFLKGPEYVFAPGFAEKAFMEGNREAEELVPIDELQTQLNEQGFDLDLSTLSYADLDLEIERSIRERAVDLIAYNGQRAVPGFTDKGKVAVISTGCNYPSGIIRKADAIIALDIHGDRGALRRIDHERFRSFVRRFKAAKRYYDENRNEIEASYAAWRDKVTSFEFWIDYLGI